MSAWLREAWGSFKYTIGTLIDAEFFGVAVAVALVIFSGLFFVASLLAFLPAIA